MARHVERSGAPSFLGEISLTPLKLENEASKTTFVGGILYNQGKNFLVIGNQDNRLITGQINPKRDQDFLSIVNETRRVITLNTFQNVAVRQVDLDPVEIKKPTKSVHKHAELSLHLDVRNPENNQTEKLTIREEDILDIFTGKRGGIAVFSGKGFPDETGLLFERTVGDQKEAIVLFMHPQSDDPHGVNSVDGLEFFLNQINNNLASDSDSALQVQALNALSAYEKRGKLDFKNNDLRREIFKLQVTAFARQGVTTALDIFIPQTTKKIRKHSLVVPKDYQKTVNGGVDSVIVDFNRPLSSEDPSISRELDILANMDKKVGKKPQTQQGKELLKTFRKAMFNATQEDMVVRVSTFNRVVSWLRDPDVTDVELDDIQILINKMERKLRSNSTRKITDPEGTEHILLEYRDKLMGETRERRNALRYN